MQLTLHKMDKNKGSKNVSAKTSRDVEMVPRSSSYMKNQPVEKVEEQGGVP